ncbi:MAG: GNAT family N-acetyltransferase [Anaerolineae bacterium]|nr:GNAT family N-acetyltransferase [Anaerolineae bacterium]
MLSDETDKEGRFSPTGEAVRLRRMTLADIPLGMRLKALAGWNQTATDWQLLLDAGMGWVAAYGGVDAGTATLVTYGDAFSWIGMVLVDPAYRRRGIGTALLRTALAEAQRHGVPRLDATPQGQPLYEGLGFRNEYRLSRMMRPIGGIVVPDAVAVEGSAAPLTLDRIGDVLRLDVPVFGADRRLILEALRMQAPRYARCWLVGDHVRGYCLGRSGSRCEQIGPIVAESVDVATALLAETLKACAQRPVIIDAPDDKADWGSRLRSLGFSVQRSFSRMALSDRQLPGDPARTFAIAGPAFG